MSIYCTNGTCKDRDHCKTAQQFTRDKQPIYGQGHNAVRCPDFVIIAAQRYQQRFPDVAHHSL